MVSHRTKFLIPFLAAFAAGPLLAEDVDPANDGSQYAWFPNAGWINAEPLGDGGPGMSLGETDASGWLWSANAGWISLSCENTASCATVDYRVNHDGSGILSGYGWSPNLGWISFSCVDSGTCGDVGYSVVVDLVSGEMSGDAWAANAGWISMSCQNTASCGSVDYGIRLDVVPPEPPIFLDGFESS
jgi:hypothetical protein